MMILVIAVFALAYCWANWEDRKDHENSATGINKLPRNW
jgi:hypothetical protein